MHPLRIPNQCSLLHSFLFQKGMEYENVVKDDAATKDIKEDPVKNGIQVDHKPDDRVVDEVV